MKHVHDSGDLFVFVPDRYHQGGDVLAEILPQGVEGGVIIHIVLVHFGDVDDAGHFPLGQIFPGPFRADGQAALGRAHQDTRVRYGQALGHLAGEVEIARRVQHVDLAAVIFYGGDSGGNRDLPLDLLRIIVTDGVPLRGPAHAVAAAGQGEKALDEGGLSVTTMAQQADISDVLRRITHNLFHSLRFEGRLAGQVTRQPLLTII